MKTCIATIAMMLLAFLPEAVLAATSNQPTTSSIGLLRGGARREQLQQQANGAKTEAAKRKLDETEDNSNTYYSDDDIEERRLSSDDEIYVECQGAGCAALQAQDGVTTANAVASQVNTAHDCSEGDCSYYSMSEDSSDHDDDGYGSNCLDDPECSEFDDDEFAEDR